MSVPAETYTFGINYIFMVLSMVLVLPVLIYVVVPVFYENNVSNCYEVGGRSQFPFILYIIYIHIFVYLIPVPGNAIWQAHAKGGNSHICVKLLPHAARVYVHTLSGICARYIRWQLPTWQPLYLLHIPVYLVTGINIHLINILVCSICVVYTMLGGIKAVVWTDVVQGAIMLISVLLVGVLGTMQAGGLSSVLESAAKGGRLNFE